MAGVNSDERYERLKQEVYRLFEFVQQIKQQIASVKHPRSQIDPFGTVAEQLKAIVKSTEDASETIMSSTESILSEVVPLSSAIRFSEAQERFAKINDACNGIFEACAFQDLTGQRISKIGRTMTKIEHTLDDIVKLVGGPEGMAEVPAPVEEPRVRDGVVLDGPQLEGEGVSQGDIDQLFQKGAAAKQASAKPDPQPKPPDAPATSATAKPATVKAPAKPAAAKPPAPVAETPAKRAAEPAKPAPAEAKPAPAAEPAKPAPAEPAGNSQADIDKLFDSPGDGGATVSQADIDKLFG